MRDERRLLVMINLALVADRRCVAERREAFAIDNNLHASVRSAD